MMKIVISKINKIKLSKKARIKIFNVSYNQNILLKHTKKLIASIAKHNNDDMNSHFEEIVLLLVQYDYLSLSNKDQLIFILYNECYLGELMSISSNISLIRANTI